MICVGEEKEEREEERCVHVLSASTYVCENEKARDFVCEFMCGVCFSRKRRRACVKIARFPFHFCLRSVKQLLD